MKKLIIFFVVVIGAVVLFKKVNRLEQQSDSSVENISSNSAPINNQNKLVQCLDNKLIGEWESIEDKKLLSFNTECEFFHESCEVHGKYFTTSKDEDGKVDFELESKKFSNCLPIGKSECDFKIVEGILEIDCKNFQKKFLSKSLHQETITSKPDSEIKVEKIKEEKKDEESLNSDQVDKNNLDEDDENSELASDRNAIKRIDNCDGVYRKNARECYYKNLPPITVSGGPIGKVFWTSEKLNQKTFSHQFIAERRFNIRVIARKGEKAISTFGKNCEQQSFKANKYRIKLKIKRENSEWNQTVSLVTSLDKPSKIKRFKIPRIKNQKYVLDVIGVESNLNCMDHTCVEDVFRSMSSSEYRIAPECGRFEIQFATEKTYDLPKF